MAPDGPEPPSAVAPAPFWRDFLLPAIALLVLATVAHLAASRWESWQAHLAALGPAAPALYLLLWLTLVPCGFPAAALGLMAGFIFGPWHGSAWASGGLVLSGIFMHALGRRWLRPRLAQLVASRPRLAPLENAAATGGVRLHLLARLSPLNYAVVCYTLAAGGASLRTYALGLPGAIPGLIAYVWLGAAAARGSRVQDSAEWTGLVAPLLGGLSLLVLTVVLVRFARRTWRGSEEDSGRGH